MYSGNFGVGFIRHIYHIIAKIADHLCWPREGHIWKIWFDIPDAKNHDSTIGHSKTSCCREPFVFSPIHTSKALFLVFIDFVNTLDFQSAF